MSIPATIARRRVAPSSAQLLTAAVLVAVGARLPAQVQFAPVGLALPATMSETLAVVLGDVDGDGDLDLVTGNGGGYYGYVSPAVRQNRLYLNDGRGRFVDATGGLPVDDDPTTALALGDIDGDGDLDLVVGNGYYPAEQNRLYRNDGQGTFVDVTATQLPAIGDFTFSIAVGDVDGDGDVDLIFGNSGQNRLLLNDGAGTFVDATAAGLPVDNTNTQDVALADVDADGDLDLLLGNWGVGARLLVNTGGGVFQNAAAGQLPFSPDPSRSLAVGDVDGDGDLDLVVGNGGSYQCGPFFPCPYVGSQDRLYLNGGAGVFVDATSTALPSQADFTSALALGDIDEDGDLDLVATAWAAPYLFGGSASPRIYRNDGGGIFVDETAAVVAQTPQTSGQHKDVAVGDLDADGDLDLVLASTIELVGAPAVFSGGEEIVLPNLLRQLDAPAAPTVGQAYQLDVYARYGVPRQFDVALPYLSLAPANVPVPGVGTIGIDFAQAAPLPLLPIPQPAGVASTSFVVPNNASLVGLELFAQAAHVPFPLPIRLTNAMRGVVQ